MKAARGFTLLEVMVALAVIAIALGAIIKGVTEATATATYLRDRTFAHFVAMNRTTELQLARDWPPIGRTQGTVLLAGQEWLWRARIEATPDSLVRKLEIEVTLTNRQREVLDHLTAFLPRPPVPATPPGTARP